MEKETFILRIDTECPTCGMRNQIESVESEPIDFVACGKCGTLLMIPDDMTDREEDVVNQIVEKAIMGGNDAIL